MCNRIILRDTLRTRVKRKSQIALVDGLIGKMKQSMNPLRVLANTHVLLKVSELCNKNSTSAKFLAMLNYYTNNILLEISFHTK